MTVLTHLLNRLWLIRCMYFQNCSTSHTDKGVIQLLIFSFNRVLAKNNTKWSLCKATHLLSFHENDPLVKFCQPLQKVCGLFYQPWDLTSWSHCYSPLTDWPRPQVAQDLEYLYTQKCSTDKGEWSRGNAATGSPPPWAQLLQWWDTQQVSQAHSPPALGFWSYSQQINLADGS